MKKVIVLSFLSGFLTVIGCGGFHLRPLAGHPGIESSILPVFVHATGKEVETEFHNRTTTTSRYHACVGVYVRPHVIVTAASVFPNEMDEVSVQSVDDIFVGGDFDRRTVKGFHVLDSVAVIVTEESGRPVPLRPGQAAVGQKLTKLGLVFAGSSSPSLHAAVQWDVGEAIIVDTTFAGITDEDLPDVYRAKAEFHPGQCGAPLVDDGGRLVGIIGLGSPGKKEVSVLNAAMIDGALKEAGL